MKEAEIHVKKMKSSKIGPILCSKAPISVTDGQEDHDPREDKAGPEEAGPMRCPRAPTRWTAAPPLPQDGLRCH